MDKKLRNALLILIGLGIVYMTFLVYPLLSGLIKDFLGVISPFIVGFAIAFILHPLVDWLVDKKVKRIYAVLLVVVALLAVVVVFFGSFLPLVFAQFLNVIKIAPGVITDIITYFEGIFNFDAGYNLETFDWQTVLTTGFDTTGDFVTFLISRAYTSVSFVLITPILLIYFLFDYNNIREYIKNFLTRHDFTRMYAFSKEYEKLLSRYVGGLLVVMVVLTLISTVMFSISGLEYALLFGFIIGITNMIPFIGNIIGGAIAILFAMSQSMTLAIIIAIEVVVLIIVESNFVTPMIQGKSVDINPLAIIFGITVFGYIFGFVGVLLAIPMIIFFKLIMKHYFEKL